MGTPMSRYQLCRIVATVLLLGPGPAASREAQAAAGSIGTRAAAGSAKDQPVGGSTGAQTTVPSAGSAGAQAADGPAGAQAPGGPAGKQAAAGPAEAQPAGEPGYRPPRTPDGQPDISGIWTNDTLTPLERPPELWIDPLSGLVPSSTTAVVTMNTPCRDSGAGRQDDERSRALRRRVTLVFGDYRGRP